MSRAVILCTFRSSCAQCALQQTLFVTRPLLCSVILTEKCEDWSALWDRTEILHTRTEEKTQLTYCSLKITHSTRRHSTAHGGLPSFLPSLPVTARSSFLRGDGYSGCFSVRTLMPLLCSSILLVTLWDGTKILHTRVEEKTQLTYMFLLK